MSSALNQLEIKDGHLFLDGMMLKGITRFNLTHKGGELNPELTLKMDVRTLPNSKALQCCCNCCCCIHNCFAVIIMDI